MARNASFDEEYARTQEKQGLDAAKELFRSRYAVKCFKCGYLGKTVPPLNCAKCGAYLD